MSENRDQFHANAAPTIGEFNMNKRRPSPKLLLTAGLLIIFAILLAFTIGSIRWLDKEPWTSYPQNRWLVKTLPYFYLWDPFSSDDDDIHHTIKIAHFIALSKINEKSLDSVLIDIHESQRLIEEFVQEHRHKIDNIALAELTLERLILLNRMQAIVSQSNKQPPTDIEATRLAVRDLLPTVSDVETRRSLIKELHLYDLSWQKENLKTNVLLNEFYDFVDAYHFGLARCAVRDESGAQLIEFALENIPQFQLIEITLRNVDHPLIAAAGMSADSLCAGAIDSVYKKIKG